MDLRAYEEAEAAYVRANSPAAIARGYLASAADLYPDLAPVESRGWARGSIPLRILLLLYEQTVVYVAPKDLATLERQWGLTLADFTLLVEASLIQPIVGHPGDYTSNHFGALFERRPPSLWARGVSLLSTLGLEETLSKSNCPLPIEAMALAPNLRARYRALFPGFDEAALTTRIEEELLTNYADLWIFGEGAIADSLQFQSTPEAAIDRLYLANEIRTYPSLFGMDGSANYAAADLEPYRDLFRTLPRLATRRELRIVPDRFDELLRSVGISLEQLSASDIVEFHESGDALALRRAVRFFEEQASPRRSSPPDVQVLLEASARVADSLARAGRTLSSPTFRRKMRVSRARIDYALRAVAPALGGWLCHLAGQNFVEGMGGGFYVDIIAGDRARDAAADAAMAFRFTPGLAYLWNISRDRQ